MDLAADLPADLPADEVACARRPPRKPSEAAEWWRKAMRSARREASRWWLAPTAGLSTGAGAEEDSGEGQRAAAKVLMGHADGRGTRPTCRRP
jgi:hypothetical protein